MTHPDWLKVHCSVEIKRRKWDTVNKKLRSFWYLSTVIRIGQNYIDVKYPTGLIERVVTGAGKIRRPKTEELNNWLEANTK